MQREDLHDARFTCLLLLYHPWGQIFHSGLRSKTPGCVVFPLEPRFVSTHTKKSKLTLRRLMSYIYIYMEHLFLMFLDHTQRRTTVGRTPLDE